MRAFRRVHLQRTAENAGEPRRVRRIRTVERLLPRLCPFAGSLEMAHLGQRRVGGVLQPAWISTNGAFNFQLIGNDKDLRARMTIWNQYQIEAHITRSGRFHADLEINGLAFEIRGSLQYLNTHTEEDVFGRFHIVRRSKTPARVRSDGSSVPSRTTYQLVAQGTFTATSVRLNARLVA